MYTTLRTRVGIAKNITDQLGFFVQLQDSRIFGQEPGTLTPINNIDLHQGYVMLTSPFGFPLTFQAGRFEMAYGTERFIGAVGWHYVSRAFDGARLAFKINDNVKIDVFAVTLRDTTPYIGNAVPSFYPYPAMPVKRSSLYGIWKTTDLNKDHRLDGFVYYEINRANTPSGENTLDEFTIGLNHTGKYGTFSSLLEAAYQFGSAGDLDISAYLASLQLFYTAGISKFGIGADILSGTKPGDDKSKSFSSTYATNHKFYGYMDYFINIPSNTSNLGLNDFYASALLTPADSKFSGSLFVHHFTSNADPEIADLESTFGQEIDLTIKYDFIKGTALSWGASVFFPGDLMKKTFSTSFVEKEDPSFWSYLMITANL